MGTAARSSLLFLIVLHLVVPSARAGDKEAEKKAAAAEKAFLEAYAAAGADEKARAKAVDSLSSAPDSVKCSVLLGKVLPKDDAPAVYMASVAILRRAASPEGISAMAES